MMLDIDEALRYLGVPAPAPAELRARAGEIAGQLAAAVRPRWSWRAFPLAREEGGFALSGTGVVLPGDTARTMLSGCGSAAVLACTLGPQFDALLRTWQARDMSQAVICDALGSAFAEAGCDQAEQEIGTFFPGLYLTDRFSPGYGDLPLSLQPGLCAVLDAERRLGIVVTESLMLNPSKSVTAVIGISDAPQMARVRGCEYCSVRDRCSVRRSGADGGCGRPLSV